MQKADTLLRSARNPYLDDRANVQHSSDEDDQYEDNEDSSEAVLSAAPYRILERFLQSGAETPSRGEEWDFDMAPSCATSVMPAWHPPPHAGSWAPTPAYNPADHPFPESTPAKARSAHTPLFLPDPDLRAPTPFVPRDSRDFTPYVSPREARKPIASTSLSAHARPSSISPPPAAKRLRTATPLRDKARAERIFRKISKFLDTVASDSDEDPEEAEDEDEEIRDSDLELIDNMPPQIHNLPPFHDAANDDNEEADAERLQGIAAHFESQAPDHSASVAQEAGISRFSHSAPPEDNAALVRRPGLRAETQSQMEGRLKLLLPAENENTGHLVFVLGPKKLLMAKARDIPPPPAPAQNKRQQTAKSAKKKQDAAPDVCWTNKLGKELYQKDYPQVSPSIDKLAPFRTSRCDALQRRPLSGPSQALKAGDRVLIVGGERRGETAYVRQMQELRGPRGGSERVCELRPHFPASEDAFVCPVAGRVRHILSPLPPLHIFDSVRVNSGALYCGAIGRLVSIDGPQVTVALPAETNFDEALPSKMQPDGTRHIDVPMEDINRHFLLGDVILIVRGENKLYAPRLMTPSSPEPRAVTPPWIPANASAEEEERLALEEAARQQALQFEEHRLPGELDGRWLLMPGLVGKRADVVIQGLHGFKGKPDIPRLSNTLVACEGSRGTLLLMEGQTESSLRKSVTVYHVGPKRRPLGFPASCIKPARADTAGVKEFLEL
ncbi:hypothetical protein DFH09DRAFT_1085529 [Mycena vulgaris]|nr:hypothetical protein DFH09DRAFT_1085529 [Mycena vulgaris]